MFYRKHTVNKKNFFTRPVWQNSVKNIKCNPLKYYQPQNLTDLYDIVNEAIHSDLTIRAVGAGHSYSYAPHTYGLLADMTKLDKNLGEYKFTSEQGHFYEFEGGITIRNMNLMLDKLNLSISTMGGIDHQTLAGALQTGTHGSNIKFGAISQMVRSIVIVTNNMNGTGAKAYRIERTNGITDNSKYTNDQCELIQDDDLFKSILVSFGSMGIIYSIVLEVEKLFYLEEQKKTDSWENIKTQLMNGVIQQHRSVYCQVNPYALNGVRSALIAFHDRTDELSTPEIIKEDIKHKIWHRIDKAIRNPISLLGNIPLTYWFFVFLINRYPNRIPNIINRAIRNQKDKSYINKSYKVMYQGLDYLKERAYDSEFAIEIENNKHIELMDALIALLEDLHKKFRFQLSSPLGMRFVKSSDAFLTPEFEKDVCYIDTPVLKHSYGNEILLYEIQQLFIKFGAKPHWGKMNEHVNKEYIIQSYPRFNTWKKFYDLLNRNGIFSNRFTRQMIG